MKAASAAVSFSAINARGANVRWLFGWVLCHNTVGSCDTKYNIMLHALPGILWWQDNQYEAWSHNTF